jgi:hypothetical protein
MSHTTALYLSLVATIAALVGQHIVRKLIILFGRASLIIFILAGTIFISAISLGKHGHFSDVQSQSRNCTKSSTFGLIDQNQTVQIFIVSD